MPPRLLDLDNFKTVCAQIYEALAARDKDRYSTDVAIIPKKQEAVGNQLALPFAAISLTTAKIDV